MKGVFEVSLLKQGQSKEKKGKIIKLWINSYYSNYLKNELNWLLITGSFAKWCGWNTLFHYGDIDSSWSITIIKYDQQCLQQ